MAKHHQVPYDASCASPRWEVHIMRLCLSIHFDHCDIFVLRTVGEPPTVDAVDSTSKTQWRRAVCRSRPSWIKPITSSYLFSRTHLLQSPILIYNARTRRENSHRQAERAVDRTVGTLCPGWMSLFPEEASRERCLRRSLVSEPLPILTAHVQADLLHHALFTNSSLVQSPT